jgi:hypothetical protein
VPAKKLQAILRHTDDSNSSESQRNQHEDKFCLDLSSGTTTSNHEN